LIQRAEAHRASPRAVLRRAQLLAKSVHGVLVPALRDADRGVDEGLRPRSHYLLSLVVVKRLKQLR
jgi:hypothetical protein